MPAPLTTTLLVFAAILTCVSPVAAVVFAGIALVLEFVLAFVPTSDG